MVLWVLAAFSGLALTFYLTALLAIAAKRWLPYEEVRAERVSLTAQNANNVHVAFATVTFRYGNGRADSIHLRFWSANRERILASRRYRRIVDFYTPGKVFRLHRFPAPGFCVPIPECPVVRAESVIVAVGAWLFLCMFGGVVAALWISR
jgi:hypothetical protein